MAEVKLINELPNDSKSISDSKKNRKEIKNITLNITKTIIAFKNLKQFKCFCAG